MNIERIIKVNNPIDGKTYTVRKGVCLVDFKTFNSLTGAEAKNTEAVIYTLLDTADKVEFGLESSFITWHGNMKTEVFYNGSN